MVGWVVVVNGYKLVREALVERGEDYVDRPYLPLLYEAIGSKGMSTHLLGMHTLPTHSLRMSGAYLAKLYFHTNVTRSARHLWDEVHSVVMFAMKTLDKLKL